MEFHTETFLKLVPPGRSCNGFTYELGLNVNVYTFNSSPKKCVFEDLYYTDIENIHLFENKCDRNDNIMIVKIPVEVPIVKLDDGNKYKSLSIFVESIHSYSDFLQDDGIATDLKKSMKRVDIRMPLHQTKKTCLEAVKKDGNSIQYIKDSVLNKEICLEAVKNTGISIGCIKNSLLLDKEICLEAVKNSEYAIYFIKDSPLLDKEICIEAVKKDIFAINLLQKMFSNH